MSTDPKAHPALPGSDRAAGLPAPGKEAGAGMGGTGSRADRHPLFFPLGTAAPASQSDHSTSGRQHAENPTQHPRAAGSAPASSCFLSLQQEASTSSLSHNLEMVP